MLTITIIIAAVAVIAVLLVVISMQPGSFRVTRSGMVSAPPEVAFAQVNDFHKWQAWSPWAKLDSDVKNTYAGPEAGTGAIFSWAGNAKVGEGRMTIIESQPSELVKIRLEFFKPFVATHAAELTFKPVGMQTEVTWSMYGKNSFMAKAMTLVMSCDKMIGGFYEKGLVSLDAVSREASSQEAAR
jgi:hypothetical protein